MICHWCYSLARRGSRTCCSRARSRATRSVSAVLVPLQSEFDRLQGRHNCPRKGPDYRERAQKYRHALAQAEVLEVPAREAVEPATSSLDCA